MRVFFVGFIGLPLIILGEEVKGCEGRGEGGRKNNEKENFIGIFLLSSADKFLRTKGKVKAKESSDMENPANLSVLFWDAPSCFS